VTGQVSASKKWMAWWVGAMVVGLLLRALPLWLWGWSSSDCTRDECIYRIAAQPIVDGDGLGLAPAGWLPAPGYPYLLAWCAQWLGSFEAVKWVQVALFAPTVACLSWIARRIGDAKAAVWAAWLFALHPTFVFFSGTMWTETVYTSLLVASVAAMLWARDHLPRRAWLVGALVGLTVLFRGVATYTAPFFLLGLVWPVPGGETVRQRLKPALLGFALAWAVVVLPYSASASARWGGPVISDATLGHVARLGNNDFEPVTFDYALGPLTGRTFSATLGEGRAPCPRRTGPLERDRCEVAKARAWVMDHPTTFVSRMPLRVAQMLNPNSFLTRHLRWNFWPTLPWAAKELLVLLQVLSSGVVVLGGTWALLAVKNTPFRWVCALLGAYQVAVVACLYGISRFRLPLEALWIVALAVGLSAAGSREVPRAQRWVRGGIVLVLAYLMSWFAKTGFPGF